MRYFIVNYYRQANGQMDESVSVSKRAKTKDLQSASVILDFKEQQVIKSSLNGVVIPKDWNRILGFYYQHYPHILDRLARENGLEIKQQTPEPEQTRLVPSGQ